MTAVGDPDQNIYAWRGASLFNLLDFPEQFPRADGSPSTQLPLYTNFRSGAWILEAADVVISKLPEQQRPDPDKRLVPWIENGTGEVHVARISDEWKEAEWIADHILELHEDGAKWSDVAVLCRSSRLFFSLQQAFAEREIPAEILGLAGLLRLPEIVEVLAYARAVSDPLASVALAKILLGPALPRRLQGSRARGGAREDEELRVTRGGRGGGRGDPVPVRRGARASRSGRAALGRGSRAARGVPA